MKTLCTLMLCSLLPAAAALAQDAERSSFNKGWKFSKAEKVETEQDSLLSYSHAKPYILPTGNAFLSFQSPHAQPSKPFYNGQPVAIATTEYNDKDWRALDLPHDWGIEGPFKQEYPGETAKLPWWGNAWYRKVFRVDAADKGKDIYLDIDGAMSYSTVYCNGKLVGGWPYGYTSYRVDLTPYLKFGEENTVAVRLENIEESSRWYPGGGIYRNVWLVKKSPVGIAHWGTYITTPQVSAERASIHMEITLQNTNNSSGAAQVVTKVYRQDKDGKPTGAVICSSETSLPSVTDGQTISQKMYVDSPAIWDIDTPNLYTAVTSVQQGGKEIDSYSTSFGIREFKVTSSDGFYLNGRKLPLQGVCLHHDLGALGAAFNVRAMERQLEMMKEMGVNAIRTTHNPSAPEMLDLCDRMGFVVLDELTDTWTVAKKPNGYALLFDDWHEQDLRALIRRDRNHPSVIMWSTGNEIAEQVIPEKFRLAQLLTDIAHDEDPTRPATYGCDRPKGAENGFCKTADVYGFNYKPMMYAGFHKQFPGHPYYGSETSSCISTRGEYFFPVSYNKDLGKSDFQVSSYDLYAPAWAMAPDWEFKGQDENPENLGEFVWTGFDYLGEPTPYNSDLTVLTNFSNPEEQARAKKELEAIGRIAVPSRSSYFGIIDLAGFPKDRYYIYQSRWRPELPMAHILPHWNWPERVGEVTPVHVYTSGDAAELFINGKSQGMKKKKTGEEVPTLEEIRRQPELVKDIYRLCWDEVVYEPGEVKVVAYKDGKVWAEDRVVTAGKTAKMEVTSDRPAMKADGSDLLFVSVRLTDKDGNFSPRADNLIKFSVEGAARIAATDNGDPTSLESFQNPYVKAFNGCALVILRSNGTEGDIRLTVKSKGLPTQTLTLKAEK